MLPCSLEPLRDLLPPAEPDGATIPFVVVVPHLPVVAALESVHTAGGSGFTTMDDDDLAGFRPLPELRVPAGPYLLLDVDPGADTLNQRPAEVLPRLTPRAARPSRSPRE